MLFRFLSKEQINIDRGKNSTDERESSLKTEEECPECDRKFPDLKRLSEHFDDFHDESDHEDRPFKETSVKTVQRRKVDLIESKKTKIQEHFDVSDSSKGIPLLRRSERTKVDTSTGLDHEIKREIRKRINEENSSVGKSTSVVITSSGKAVVSRDTM